MEGALEGGGPMGEGRGREEDMGGGGRGERGCIGGGGSARECLEGFHCVPFPGCLPGFGINPLLSRKLRDRRNEVGSAAVVRGTVGGSSVPPSQNFNGGSWQGYGTMVWQKLFERARERRARELTVHRSFFEDFWSFVLNFHAEHNKTEPRFGYVPGGLKKKNVVALPASRHFPLLCTKTRCTDPWQLLPSFYFRSTPLPLPPSPSTVPLPL